MKAEDFFADSSGGNRCNVVAAQLREMIASGEAPKGKPLKGATALGKLFGCSGSPVETARRKLVKEGLIVKKDDGLYYVADDAEQQATAPAEDPFKGLDE